MTHNSNPPSFNRLLATLNFFFVGFEWINRSYRELPPRDPFLTINAAVAYHHVCSIFNEGKGQEQQKMAYLHRDTSVFTNVAWLRLYPTRRRWLFFSTRPGTDTERSDSMFSFLGNFDWSQMIYTEYVLKRKSEEEPHGHMQPTTSTGICGLVCQYTSASCSLDSWYSRIFFLLSPMTSSVCDVGIFYPQLSNINKGCNISNIFIYITGETHKFISGKVKAVIWGL